ncbi:MAG: hypothetical protein WD578_05515 [Bacteroidales bacterium]
MNGRVYIAILLVILVQARQASGQSDSLVRYSDLKFHSAFEKQSFQDFVHGVSGPFNLYLAINEDMTGDEAEKLYETYQSVFSTLQQKKVERKKEARKVKLTYGIVHNQFLDKYVASSYFPAAFNNGTYNCVTASMIYAMVFDELQIPYRVMASTSHVYLVANPGINSIVIETTNPSFADQLFTGEYKRNYINHLRASKMISEQELKNKSVDELFEANFNEVHEVQPGELPGIQYYNRGYQKFEEDAIQEAYELFKKAWFFFPDKQVDYLLSVSLLMLIESSEFNELEDIDMIAQFSKFKNSDIQIISGIFQNIVNHHQQFNDRGAFCDSMYHRLISKLQDTVLIEEISFRYNLLMAFHSQGSDDGEKYMIEAIKLRTNHRDLNTLVQIHFETRLNRLRDPGMLLEEVSRIREVASFGILEELLSMYELYGTMASVKPLVDNKKIREAEALIEKFEQNWQVLPTHYNVEHAIAEAYRSLAVYYFYRGNKTRARSIVERGLQYVPGNKFLKSAVY